MQRSFVVFCLAHSEDDPGALQCIVVLQEILKHQHCINVSCVYTLAPSLFTCLAVCGLFRKRLFSAYIPPGKLRRAATTIV